MCAKARSAQDEGFPFVNLFDPKGKIKLEGLGSTKKLVQWDRPLSDAAASELARVLKRFPHLGFRAYWPAPLPSAEQFRLWRGLRSFEMSLVDTASLEPLAELAPDLQGLSISIFRSRAPSLRVLEHFPRLERLGVEGTLKHFDSIWTRAKLKSLYLNSTTLLDLAPLASLPRLKVLSLALGSLRSLEGLPPSLNSLWIRQVRDIADLTPISRAVALRELWLQNLQKVARLPDLSRLTSLEVLKLWGMKTIRELSPLAACSKLKTIEAFDMRQLEADDFACLIGHPGLRSVRVSTRSSRKDSAIGALLGLDNSGNVKRPKKK